MKYSFLRNRRGYQFHIFLLLAFVFVLPSSAHSACVPAEALCTYSRVFHYTNVDGNNMDYDWSWSSCGLDRQDYNGQIGETTWKLYGTVYYWVDAQGGWEVAAGPDQYTIGTETTQQAMFDSAWGWSDHVEMSTTGTPVSPSTQWPNGCVDLPDNSVPCDDYVTEPDSDSDGICDRCDYDPYDNNIGTDVYLIWEYSFEGTVIAQEYSIIPPADLINLPEDTIPHYTYTSSLGDPDSDIDLTGTDVSILFDSSPAATMQTCACDTPCTLTTTPGSGMTTGDYEYTGTESDPETPPQITLEGSSVQRQYLTSDPVGEHGTTTTGTDAPGTGSTDNEFLESIANNQSTTAGNLDALGNILDVELNELNANTARTASNVSDLNQTTKDQFADDTIQSGDTSSLLNSVTGELETLGDGLLDSITADITEQSENSVFTTSFFDGVIEEFTSIFTSGECVDLSYYIPSLDRSVTLTCEFSEKFKTIFGFMVAIYTIMTLIDILFTGIVPKGTAPVGLFSGSKVD